MPFILDDRGNEIQWFGAQEVGRFTQEGRTFVTTSNYQTYGEFPLYNVITGEEDTLWLTPDQVQKYAGVYQDYDPVDPRIFDLHTIGIYNPDRQHQKSKKDIEPQAFIQGFLSPNSTKAITHDRAGHWWAGSCTRRFVRPYLGKKSTRATPDIRFLVPDLGYLGEGSEFWVDTWYNKGEKRRLVLCTRTVLEVIEELGVFEHYHPSPAAMTDPKLARVEATKVRDIQVEHIQKTAQQLTKEVDRLEKAMAQKIEGEKFDARTITGLREEVESLRATNATLVQENALLQQRRPRREFDALWGNATAPPADKGLPIGFQSLEMEPED